jgi:hypothetical protein
MLYVIWLCAYVYTVYNLIVCPWVSRVTQKIVRIWPDQYIAGIWNCQATCFPREEAVKASINTHGGNWADDISRLWAWDLNGPHRFCISQTFDSSRLHCYTPITLRRKVEYYYCVSICRYVCVQVLAPFFSSASWKKPHDEVQIVHLLLSMVQLRTMLANFMRGLLVSYWLTAHS